MLPLIRSLASFLFIGCQYSSNLPVSGLMTALSTWLTIIALLGLRLRALLGRVWPWELVGGSVGCIMRSNWQSIGVGADEDVFFGGHTIRLVLFPSTKYFLTMDVWCTLGFAIDCTLGSAVVIFCWFSGSQLLCGFVSWCYGTFIIGICDTLGSWASIGFVIDCPYFVAIRSDGNLSWKVCVSCFKLSIVYTVINGSSELSFMFIETEIKLFPAAMINTSSDAVGVQKPYGNHFNIWVIRTLPVCLIQA